MPRFLAVVHMCFYLMRFERINSQHAQNWWYSLAMIAGTTSSWDFQTMCCLCLHMLYLMRPIFQSVQHQSQAVISRKR
jgi:hypothetical protein